MKNRIFAIILSIVLIVLIVPTARYSAEEKSSFSGTRSISLITDVSDLNNFLSGGKATFDLALRKAKPEWLNLQAEAKDRDFNVSISFEFSSKEDYIAKLEQLLIYTPAVYFEDGKDVMLLESFDAAETVNFIKNAFVANEYIEEKSLGELFKIKNNQLILNGKKYETTEERISVYPKNKQPIIADGISIETKITSKGKYERTVNVLVYSNGNDDDRLKTFIKRFKKVGKFEQENNNQASVTFTAESESEMIQNTIACFYAISSINETSVYIDNKTIGVTRTEIIDLDHILAEGGEFNYSTTYPSNYRNLKSNSESIAVENGVVSAQNQREIEVYYECGFKFAKIENITNLENVLGRIEKTVRFYAPLNIVVPYYGTIKTAFQERMIDGVQLNIYDKDGMRCFEFVFSAWYTSQIEEFDKAIFADKNSKFDLECTFFPYAINTLREDIDTDEVLPGIESADSVEHICIKSGISIFAEPSSSKEQNMVENTLSQNEEGSFVVDLWEFNFLCTLLWAVLIFALIILTKHLLKKVPKIKMKYKAKAEERKKMREEESKKIHSAKHVQSQEPEQTKGERILTKPIAQEKTANKSEQDLNAQSKQTEEDIQKATFCRMCGTQLKKENLFCPKCGAKKR